jgi:hypothetical protein
MAPMQPMQPMQLRASLHAVEPSPLAGGPIELELTVEAPAEGAIYVMFSGDRMRMRSGDLAFAASCGGAVLADPKGDLPNLGGPSTLVAVRPGTPHRRTLLLNDFVRLEDALDVVPPDTSAELFVTCVWSPRLAADERASSGLGDPLRVEMSVTLAIRRDDDALVALVDRLVDHVFHGEPGVRVRSLELVSSLRAPIAVARWRALAAHPDASVGASVAPALHFAARGRAGQVTP